MKQRNLLIDYANPGNNSYGFVRLIAALAVVLSHSSILSGGLSVKEPMEVSTGYPLGAHAVHVFFVLSGLMVTASFERSSSIYQFFWARLLRIYPALIFVSITITIIGGFFYTTASQSDYWSLSNTGEYLLRNMLLIGGGAGMIGVFENNPIPNEINTPLWTLKFEILCYISLIVSLGFVKVFSAPEMRYKISIIIVIFILAISVFLHIDPRPYHESTHFDHAIRMGFAFYLGCLAWLIRAHLVLSARIFGALLVIALVFNYFDLPLNEQTQIIFLGYSVIWLGHFNAGKAQRFINTQDYSYGVYIIGFPVQQALVHAYAPMTPLEVFCLAGPITLVLAALSWNMVERPALRLKKLFNSAET